MPASLSYALSETEHSVCVTFFSVRVPARDAAACVSASPWRLTVHARGALAQLAWAGGHNTIATGCTD